MIPELQKIVESIKEWNLLIKHGKTDLILSLLEQGDYFIYEIRNVEKSKNIHVYPGVTEEKLYFYCIPCEFDSEEYKDTIVTYIEQCHVYKSVQNSNEITEEDALKRIQNWRTHLKEWLPKQSHTTDGIFKAYIVPTEDLINSDKVLAYFALKNNLSDSQFSADLIFKKKNNTYYDTVRPVPPFDPFDNLFLLDLIEDI